MKIFMAPDAGPLFIDTWGWLALEDARDAMHGAVERLRVEHVQLRRAWVTTDYVLDETITRLFRRRPFREAERFCDGIFEAITAGGLVLELISPERFEKAYQRRRRYRDKPRVSFTDFTSFVVMEELRIGSVLTGDAHFLQAGFQLLP